jgi:dynein heavy chain
MILDNVVKLFKLTREDIFDQERLLFGDFMDGNIEETRPYKIIGDLPSMVAKIEEYLEDFNSATKSPMRLVMFLDACEHVVRICRILRQPLGNALLLGVGGSGRQSLCKLATSISSYALFQIEVVKGYSMKDWRENLKTCLLAAGTKQRQTTFLFVDTQIINEQ